MTSSREIKKVVWGLFLEDALRFFPKGLKMFAVIRATGILGNLSFTADKRYECNCVPLIYRESEVFTLCRAGKYPQNR